MSRKQTASKPGSGHTPNNHAARAGRSPAKQHRTPPQRRSPQQQQRTPQQQQHRTPQQQQQQQQGQRPDAGASRALQVAGIVCGDVSASFLLQHLTKTYTVQLQDGSCVAPQDFEALAGKEACRNWKSSIQVVEGGQRVMMAKWLEQQGLQLGRQSGWKAWRQPQQLQQPQQQVGEEAQQQQEGAKGGRKRKRQSDAAAAGAAAAAAAAAAAGNGGGGEADVAVHVRKKPKPNKQQQQQQQQQQLYPQYPEHPAGLSSEEQAPWPDATAAAAAAAAASRKRQRKQLQQQEHAVPERAKGRRLAAAAAAAGAGSGRGGNGGGSDGSDGGVGGGGEEDALLSYQAQRALQWRQVAETMAAQEQQQQQQQLQDGQQPAMVAFPPPGRPQRQAGRKRQREQQPQQDEAPTPVNLPRLCQLEAQSHEAFEQLTAALGEAEAAHTMAAGSREAGVLWLTHTLQRITQELLQQQPQLDPQQQQQPQQPQRQPLSAADLRRMTHMARAIAADLGAANSEQLLHALEHIAAHVQTVPKHLQGDLQYCTHCRQDLEDTLLVYFLFGEDGSLQHKLCRSCFSVAFACWMEQQARQHGSWEDAAAAVTSAPRLNEQQQRQLRRWIKAAEADKAAAGFVLPSPAHEQMMAQRPLLQGGLQWPAEFCSLQGGLVALRRLQGVIARLPGFDVPQYSRLYEDAPCILDETMALSKKGSVTLTAAALQALLARVQPRQLAAAAKADLDTTSTAEVIHTMLHTVGAVQGPQQQQQGQQQRGRGHNRGSGGSSAAAAAAGGSSSGSSGERPYYNFNPIDQQDTGGMPGASLCEADAAVSKHLGSIWDTTRPSDYTEAAWGVAQQHVKQLHRAARAAKDGGQAAEAAACRFLATVLRIRFSRGCGEVAVQDLLTQVLVLLGGKGTGTRGHIDPAAALTYAFGVDAPGRRHDPQQVLAVWLFVSPEVFTQPVLLRQLLWGVQRLLLQRAVAARTRELTAARAAVPGVQLANRSGRQPAAVRAAQEGVDAAQAALAQHDQQWQQLQQEWQQPVPAVPAEGSSAAAEAAIAAAAAAEAAANAPLTDTEVQWLQSLFTYSFLSVSEMRALQAELGPQYALLLQQRGGQGVSVPVGWMHWVINPAPCIKVAWEVVRVQQMAGAAAMQRRLRCKTAGLVNDYLCVVPSAVRELLRWEQFM